MMISWADFRDATLVMQRPTAFFMKPYMARMLEQSSELDALAEVLSAVVYAAPIRGGSFLAFLSAASEFPG